MDILSGVMAAGVFEEEKKRRSIMGNDYVSPILKGLIGKECIISADELDDEHCKVLDVDAQWIMLLVHGRKGDSTYVEKIDSISEIQVL